MVERDRDLFTGTIAPDLPAAELTSRAAVFRRWLQARRERTSRPTPGECFAAGWQALLTFALFGGLALGGSVAGALLAYSDPEPINAPLFFACTAGAQMALLLAGFAAWLLRRWLGSIVGDFAPLRSLLSALLVGVGATLRRLPGEKRERVREALGVLDRRHEIYGSLPKWPVLLITQLFAVAFNVGVLATTLLTPQFRDMRFGWETTSKRTDEGMHRIVAAIAVPWKWAVLRAHPSETQIADSRYRHGQSASSLPDDAAHSWWPFLAWAVVTYGLLPRVALFTLAACGLRRDIQRLRFDHAEANALWRRMTGPLVTTSGIAIQTDEAASASGESSHVTSRQAGECLAVVATELALEEAAVARQVGRLGWQLRASWPAQIDNRRESEGLFAEVRGAEDLAGVVVVVPARRDPILAIALFLRELEGASGARGEVLVLLTGTPAGEGRFDPVDDESFAIWERFRKIQRLRLGIERWS